MFPILIETSFFTLYSYPLFMGLSWGFGYYFTRYLLEKYQRDTQSLFTLFLSLFFTSWMGAKIFFLLFSSENKFQQYLYADQFWLGGGFVFYGGLLLGLAFYFIYSLGFKKFPFKDSKFLLPGLIFGHAIGRVGCFFTGCCFGSVCELFWGVHMHGELRHPVQLYEAAGLTIIGIIVLKLLKQKRNNGIIILSYLLPYSVLRFVVEFFRGDHIRGIYYLSLSTSQFVSIALFFVTLFLYWYTQVKNLKE